MAAPDGDFFVQILNVSIMPALGKRHMAIAGDAGGKQRGTYQGILLYAWVGNAIARSKCWETRKHLLLNRNGI